jgi:hypothetical protein
MDLGPPSNSFLSSLSYAETLPAVLIAPMSIGKVTGTRMKKRAPLLVFFSCPSHVHHILLFLYITLSA